MEDFRLLQSIRQQQATSSLREVIAQIRTRSGQVDSNELNGLIEAARAEFYQLQSRQPDAR